MDIQELRRLRPALDRFVAQFDPCIKTGPSRQHMRTYLNGQLGPLERKSIEPIALDAGGLRGTILPRRTSLLQRLPRRF